MFNIYIYVKYIYIYICYIYDPTRDMIGQNPCFNTVFDHFSLLAECRIFIVNKMKKPKPCIRL